MIKLEEVKVQRAKRTLEDFNEEILDFDSCSDFGSDISLKVDPSEGVDAFSSAASESEGDDFSGFGSGEASDEGEPGEVAVGEVSGEPREGPIFLRNVTWGVSIWIRRHQ